MLIPEDSTVELCCKSVGTVVIQGCLTLGTAPFDVLGGQYITSTFYASYQCAGRPYQL